jgi:endogenous inhibitor of DNA gyrase (YacG/DUF329 family)
MNRETCLHLFERSISGDASPDELILLKTFLENDVDLNQWLENQVVNSSETIDTDVEMKMLKDIRSQINYDNIPYILANKKNRNINPFCSPSNQKSL